MQGHVVGEGGGIGSSPAFLRERLHWCSNTIALHADIHRLRRGEMGHQTQFHPRVKRRRWTQGRTSLRIRYARSEHERMAAGPTSKSLSMLSRATCLARPIIATWRTSSPIRRPATQPTIATTVPRRTGLSSSSTMVPSGVHFRPPGGYHRTFTEVLALVADSEGSRPLIPI